MKAYTDTPRRKHALLLIDSLAGGGAERSVLTIAEGLASRNWIVDLVSLHAPNVYSIPQGINFHQLADARRVGDAQLVQRLGKAVDAIHLTTGVPDLVLVNLLRSSRVASQVDFHGARVFHTLRNPLAAQLKHTKSWLLRLGLRRKLRHLYTGRHVIGISEGIIDDLSGGLGVQPASARTIYNPFDVAGIRHEAAAGANSAHWKRPYVLVAGHFKRQKRLDIALEAWTKADVDGDLVFLGGGANRKKRALIAQARRLGVADRVHVLDWQPAVYSWMAAARLLLLTSDFEGFGRVIVEALAVGTPVVSTDCPSGPREILTGDLARGLCPPQDVNCLATRIREYRDTPPKIPDKALDRFQLDIILDQYEQLVTG